MEREYSIMTVAKLIRCANSRPWDAVSAYETMRSSGDVELYHRICTKCNCEIHSLYR